MHFADIIDSLGRKGTAMIQKLQLEPLSPTKKIAFIGAGNMALALISGLVSSGYPISHIMACNKSNVKRREQLSKIGIHIANTNQVAVQWADVIVLAVKPQVMAEVCAEFDGEDLREKWIVSIAAGISVQRLHTFLPLAQDIIRVMPNTPSLVGAGMSGLFAKKGTNSTAKQFVEMLLSNVGKVYWVENEHKLNQIIAITGSSPAYFFRFMEAMQTSAMEMGFSAEDARFLIQQVAFGAAKMVIDNSELSLATLRENVTSKGGTTAAALTVFEQAYLSTIVNQAMNAAVSRAEEMEKLL